MNADFHFEAISFHILTKSKTNQNNLLPDWNITAMAVRLVIVQPHD